jgi:hypothetical protein
LPGTDESERHGGRSLLGLRPTRSYTTLWDVTETESPATPPRERAPAIEGTSVDGKPISFADYRGQAVLINVWSSW